MNDVSADNRSTLYCDDALVVGVEDEIGTLEEITMVVGDELFVLAIA